MTRPSAAFVILMCIALSPACGDGDLEAEIRLLGEGCLLDSDCDGDLVCVFRRCHVECAETPDCVERGLDSICVLGDKPTNVCLLPDELGCDATSSCPGDTVCGRDEICRDPCASDGDCLRGQTCLKGTCADVEGEGLGDASPLLNDDKGGLEATCRYNSECLTPLACRGGICEQECLTARDCPDGATCDNVDDVDLPDALACVDTAGNPASPPHCLDGVLSGDETALDCGGSCRPCAPGAACNGPDDCTSQVCVNDTCQVPNCTDGKRNGTETGTDCGGVCPNGCPAGTHCTGPGDCQAPATCDLVSGLCVAPTCSDGQLNGSETATDCGGGECAPCAVGQGCITAGDCNSLVCVAGSCQTPSCNDGIRNQGEADVDCGGNGTGCAPCSQGAQCLTAADCGTMNCDMGLCAAPSCTDGVQNGFELGVDCGGGCPNGCALGNTCVVDADCDQGGGPAGCKPGAPSTCEAKRTVTVSLQGSGSGTIHSVVPGRINCGTNCTAELFQGEVLDLVATPGLNSTFGGFGGACAGPTCSLLVGLNDAQVVATFNPSSAGAANWIFQPQWEDIGYLNVDANGFLLVAGQTSNGDDLGCYFSPQLSQDAAFGRYSPGPFALADQCVGAIAEGAATATDHGVGIHTDTTTGNYVALLIQDEAELSQLGPLTGCGASSGSRLVIAEYDPNLNQYASSARCYGNARVGPGTPFNDIRIVDQLYVNDELYLAGSYHGANVMVGDALAPMTLPPSNGGADGFVLRFDAARNVVGSYVFGGATGATETVNDITIDPVTGDILLATFARSTVDFGGGYTFGGHPSDTDAYLVRLSHDLSTTLVVRDFATAGNDEAKVVAAMPNGHVAVGLTLVGAINFGDGINSQPIGVSGYDIALVELDGATLQLAAPNAHSRLGSVYNEEPVSLWISPTTGEVVWSGRSYAAENSATWVYEGTPITQAVWVAKAPSFLAPPTWVNQTATTVGSSKQSLQRVFVTPDGQSIYVQSAGNNIDWGAGGASFHDSVHRLSP